VEAPSGQQESGFALSASLGTRVGLLSTLTTGNFAGGQGLVGNLELGFKADRIVGLLQLSFVDVSGGAGVRGTASFTMGPDFQFAIVRSDDKRVELLADIGISLGHLFGTSNTNGFTSTGVPGNLVIDYQLALGGRYWFHRQFALQGLTGFGGEAFVDLDGGGGNVSAHGVFASLGMLSVF
jgi:hypothetical protein